MYKNYESLLEMTLQNNQLTLFDLNGKEKRLNYQRHISDYIDTSNRVWKINEEQRTRTILQLTLDVWASWEIHVACSTYSFPHFGGVHVEERWLSNESGSPPCILMSNSSIIEKNEQLTNFPYEIHWKAEKALGSLTTRQFELNDCGSCWRFYLTRSLENTPGA